MYLTPQEVADELRLSLRTAYEIISSGQLKSVRLGHRTIRVKRSDLDSYLAERETKACS